MIAANSGAALLSRPVTSRVDGKVAPSVTAADPVGAAAGDRVAGRAPSTAPARWFAVLLVDVAASILARTALA